ncbi:hypothetical protein TNCV_558901 [Trichonephila clavipes]|nr:hypothetical protein TNCV_558901 [Trichonephila clavipes]
MLFPAPVDDVGDQKRMVLLPEEVGEEGFLEPVPLHSEIDSSRKGHAVPLTNHSSAIQTQQDIPAETVSKNNSVPVTTPPCHVRSTNQDTLYQAGPTTSGHIYKLDMGWRNASRSEISS